MLSTKPIGPAYNLYAVAADNVTRMLTGKGIAFTAFELSDEKLGALETAEVLGADPSQVFKTIVVLRERSGKPLLVLVPGTAKVDLKRVATVIKEKRVKLPTQNEAERITGLQAGGISPLALMNRRFDVLLDASARYFDEIHVSGGRRGLNIRLGVDDLLQLTRARLAPVASAEN